MKEQSTNPQASTNRLSDGPSGEQVTLTATNVSVTISAWMDGDEQTSLPSELFTESGQATWQVYHLIGDTLRTPELALSTKADLSRRVAQALAAEPALSVPKDDSPQADNKPVAAEVRKLTPLSKLFRRVAWPSVAIAAAVASVVWVAKPLLVPELSSPSSQTAQVKTLTPVATGLEASAVRDYVTAHRQISGPSNVRPASFGTSR
jgi:sigma-E factor negative regulatory protein RseA